jgi:hypothetical protein
MQGVGGGHRERRLVVSALVLILNGLDVHRRLTNAFSRRDIDGAMLTRKLEVIWDVTFAGNGCAVHHLLKGLGRLLVPMERKKVDVVPRRRPRAL